MLRRTALAAAFIVCDVSASDGVFIDVPFVKQADRGCGSAAISMILRHWGWSESAADPERIREATYSPQAGGTYASTVRDYFDKNGFRAFAFRGVWQDLRAHISKGRPLIAAVKLDESTHHYVVVAGVAEDFVFLNDPADRKLRKLDRVAFERRWSAADNWTLLALPHDPR